MASNNAEDFLGGSQNAEDFLGPSSKSADDFLGSTPASDRGREDNVRRLEQESMEKYKEFNEARRGRLNFREGMRASIPGIIASNVDSGRGEREFLRTILESREKHGFAEYDESMNPYIEKLNAEVLEKEQKYRQQRTAELAEYYSLPNWYEDEDFAKRLWKLAKSGGGQLAAGIFSPESYIPTEKGVGKFAAFKSFLKGVGPNMPVGALTSLMQQQIDTELGIQDSIDWDQVWANAGANAVVGGVFNSASNHGRIFPSPELDPAKRNAAKLAEMAKAKSEAEARHNAELERLNPKVDQAELKAQIAAAEAEGMNSVPPPRARIKDEYPRIQDDFRVDKSLEESQAAAMKEIDDQVPLDEIMYGTEAARNTPEKRYGKELPKLKKEFQVEEPPKTAEEFLDVPMKPNEGFGPDVEFHPIEDAPHMPGRLVEQANVDEMQGSHEMHLLGPDTYAHAEEGGVRETPRADLDQLKDDTPLHTDKEAMGKVFEAKTLDDLLAVAETHGDDTTKALAQLMRRVDPTSMREIPVELMHDKERQGTSRTNFDTGSRTVRINPVSADLSTILHETTHVYTQDAIRAVDAGTATPAQRQYVAELRHLYSIAAPRALKELPITGSLEYKLSNLHEFNAHALTDKSFREWLHSIDYEGRSLWERLKISVGKLFGIKNATLLEKMLKLTDSWKDIQISDLERVGAAKAYREAFSKAQRDEHAQNIFDATGSLFGMSDRVKNAFADKIKAHYGQFESPEALKDWLETHEIKDLPRLRRLKWSGVYTMQNQLAMMTDKNPVIAAVFNHLFDAARKSDIRINHYDNITNEHLTWVKDNAETALPFFREWEKLNVDPALRSLREQFAKDPEAFKNYLRQKSVSPEAVEHGLPLVEVMRDINRADDASLARYGRKLDREPLYFPLSRQGPYHFVITDEFGDVRWAAGHPSLLSAKNAVKEFQAQLPEGWKISDVARTDPTKVLNRAMTEALLEGAPSWLRETAMKQYSHRQEYLRNFELGRNKDWEVGGYIGQFEPKSPAEIKEQLDKYVNAFSHRVRESHYLENSSAAVDISKALLQEGGVLQEKYPATFAWVSSMVSRQMGIDLSRIGPIDDIIQGVAEGLGRGVTKLDAKLRGLEIGKDDNIIGPEFSKDVIRKFSYFVSLAKIGLVPHVLFGNAIQNVTISMDGMRNAFRLGVSPVHAIKAQNQTLDYILSRMVGRDSFPEVREKMQQAKREGIIDPHGRESFSVIEGQDANVRNLTGVDKYVQYPRDKIEQATNYWSTLYYRFFVESAFPELEGHAKDQMVYNLSRSFTGDYSAAANLMLYEKLGTIGHLGSNFSKWKFNRTSRYIDDILMMARIKDYGMTAIAPFIMSLGMGALMAGVQGTVGFVEYEALRRAGQSTGLWNWKPLSAVLKDLGIENTFFERGAVTGFSDMAAQKLFDMPSGPDISTSIRESSILDVSTVGVQYAADLVSAGKALLKAGWSSNKFQELQQAYAPKSGIMGDLWKAANDNMGLGVTDDEIKQTYNVLPTALKEAFKMTGWPGSEGSTTKITVDGKDRYVVPETTKSQGSYIRTPAQQVLAVLGGLKTTEENRFMEAKGYHRQMEKSAEGTYKALKEGILADPSNTEKVERNTRRILSEYGEDHLESVIKELEAMRTVKMRTDYFGLKEMAAMKSRDDIAAARAIERIKKARALARQRTSQDR